MSETAEQRRQPPRDHYTVGWICAIQTEFVAALELLDEEYLPLPRDGPNDNNVYAFGRIGDHDIVIASLPIGKYGTTSAATVARDMLRSFPTIKFGLMVGIAGGAPSAKHDVRLGDVVVSAPDKQSGGVIGYDFGKSIQTKQFQRTGSLNAPPLFLLNAVQMLSANHSRRGHRIAQTAEQLLQKNDRLENEYKRPGPESDRLYLSTYIHQDDKRNCKEACDQGESKLVPRPERTQKEKDKTVIHYGLIASADRLMMDAVVRDALSQQEGILCFEMEAAGLMDHFPCLVIRGICDYSDTHKNYIWQGYAAVAAAAYAKELLLAVPVTQVQEAQPATLQQAAPPAYAQQVNNFFGTSNQYGGHSITGSSFESGGGTINIG